MPKTYPQIAQHRGIREVPLPAGDGQLGGEVLKKGVGDPQVALGVLEVYGIHLQGVLGLSYKLPFSLF